MLPEVDVRAEVFADLAKADEEIAKRVAAERCPRCGGPLHVANYHRKPRGAVFAAAGESSTLRHSLCCGRRGCRKRSLPPSLRFLGRRVYLELVVLFASACAQIAAAVKEASEATGVPVRTLRRWGEWWRCELPKLGWWAELRASIVPPPPDEAQLPRSLLAKLDEVCATRQHVAWLAARCLAPGTTSLRDSARFVRDAAGGAARI